jgi:AcrR family transcriptional regulator
VARTPTITDQQILKAAAEVFLEQGFGATAVDVANRAGISSASIFKRFATKEALFFAAMNPHAERIWTAELEAQIGHGNTQADLLLIAQHITAYSAKILPRMIMAWSVRQGGELPQPPVPAADGAALAGYLAKEMALGRIARGDPTIPALTLFHTAVGFAMSQSLREELELLKQPNFLEDVVALLWRGLKPESRGAD